MRTIAALLCAVSLVTLFGCGTAGTGPEIPPGPEFYARTSPENVLDNIELAYKEMNAEEYLDCLSEDFEFFPSEQDVQNPELEIPPVWWKSDERGMHENMFGEGSNVESVSLTLTTVNIVYDYGIPEDDMDDICRCVVDVDLRVNLMWDLTLLATAQSQFDMRIDQDQPGPNGGYLWEIYQWYDLDGGGRGGWSPTEMRSWACIKSVYK